MIGGRGVLDRGPAFPQPVPQNPPRGQEGDGEDEEVVDGVLRVRSLREERRFRARVVGREVPVDRLKKAKQINSVLHGLHMCGHPISQWPTASLNQLGSTFTPPTCQGFRSHVLKILSTATNARELSYGKNC